MRQDPGLEVVRGRVIGNFRQVVKEGELRMHPQIAGLVEKEMLEKIGAAQAADHTASAT